MSYFLKNVRKEFGQDHPTFWLPTERVLQNLAKGDCVKVIFEATTDHEDRPDDVPICGERLWIVIVVAEYPRFVGRLDCERALYIAPQEGDLIDLTADHIIRVIKRQDREYLTQILDQARQEMKIDQDFLIGAVNYFTLWDDRLTECPECGGRIGIITPETSADARLFQCHACDQHYDFHTLQPILLEQKKTQKEII